MKTNAQKVFTICSVYGGVEKKECTVLYQDDSACGASGHLMMMCRGLLSSSSAEETVGYDGEGFEVCRYRR